MSRMSELEPFGVYVHWPFCRAKCPYCDFNSHVRHGGVDEARFLSAYLTELQHFASLAPRRMVTSIFFGGGTPSLMRPATVDTILEAIAGHWRVADDVEITLEANPTSVEAEKFAGYRAAGVNRSSLGVQALDDNSLKALGRQHTVQEALAALAARQAALRSRVVRSDLCARRSDGARLGDRARAARSATPPTISRSISSPSRKARRSPRVTRPARCACLTGTKRARNICSPRSCARRQACRPTKSQITRGRDRSRATICFIGAGTTMPASAPARIAASP